jgi:hypothetical protein
MLCGTDINLLVAERDGEVARRAGGVVRLARFGSR